MSVVIEKMYWVRTYLNVEYTASEGEELFLYCVNTRTFVPFIVASEIERGRFEARLNVVIVGETREPLEAGDWIICTKIPKELLADESRLFEERPYLRGQAIQRIKAELPKRERKDDAVAVRKAAECGHQAICEHPYDVHGISYAEECLLSVDEMSQAFRYANGAYMYAASLVPRVDRTDYPYVVLLMGFYKRNKNPRTRMTSLPWHEKRVLSAVANVFSKLTRRNGKTVLFFKENGDTPTGNMAALRDRLFERGLDKEFMIIEHYRNTFEGTRQSVREWLSDLRAIAKADYIFIDDYCPAFNFVRPAKGVVLTQLWHAGVGFKSVGYARFGIAGSPDPYDSAHRRYTYALVGNEYLRQIYSEVFGVEESALLATGMPRLDGFYDENRVENARSRLLGKYPWLDEGRVITFAPTFRGTGQRQAYYPYDVFLDMKRIFEMCEETNSYFVFEMHHFIDERPSIPEEFRWRVKDLSEESLDDLYHVTDVLVTDYSSCFYDYLLLEKPVVFYTPDRVAYSATRGVQRPVDQMAPGVVCDTFESFMDVLKSGDYENVKPDPSCLDRALERGMRACDRVIDTILLEKDVPGVRV